MQRSTTVKVAAASALAAAALVAGGSAMALAQGGSSTPSPSASPSASASAGASSGTDGGRGPGGASQDTAVTGTEKDKVVAAVEAKDSAVTVTEVRKDPDGSYDALGTKAGARVMVEVSKDLKTVEVRTGGPGDGHGMPGGAQGGTGTQSTNPSDANGASSTSSATTAAV